MRYVGSYSIRLSVDCLLRITTVAGRVRMPEEGRVNGDSARGAAKIFTWSGHGLQSGVYIAANNVTMQTIMLNVNVKCAARCSFAGKVGRGSFVVENVAARGLFRGTKARLVRTFSLKRKPENKKHVRIAGNSFMYQNIE